MLGFYGLTAKNYCKMDSPLAVFDNLILLGRPNNFLIAWPTAVDPVTKKNIYDQSKFPRLNPGSSAMG